MKRKIAIVGDSYSTYEGYVPEGYFCWYMKAGNECENDMPGVEKTWWYQLKEEIVQKTCQHYHVEMLALENIEKQNGRPNTKGMRQIADQVAQMLK